MLKEEVRTLRDLADKVAGHIELTKCQLEVVPVVQHVEQVGIEGVNLVQFGELVQDDAQPVMPVLLRVLDLRRH